MMCYQNLPKVQTDSPKRVEPKKIPISGCLSIKCGATPALTVWNADGVSATAESEIVPSPAINKPLSQDRLSEQLNKTGDTPFILNELNIELDEGLSLPVSEINSLRRNALSILEEKIASTEKRSLPNNFSLPKLERSKTKLSDRMKLSVMLYKFVPEFLDLPVDRIYVPLKEFMALGDEIKKAKAEIFVALPQITRGNYDRIIKSLSNIPNGILIGNISGIEQAKGHKIHADSSLNVFNSLTETQMSSLNLSGATLSVELSLNQIKDLISFSDFDKEMIVYGRIPLMVSEYCPVGCIEGDFKSNKKCLRPCKNNSYTLKDRIGKQFPIFCDDTDCRSTILNSDVTFMLDHFDKIKDAGVNMVRLNITTESLGQVKDIVDMHRDVCDNGLQVLPKYQSIIDDIKRKSFTRGHLQRGV